MIWGQPYFRIEMDVDLQPDLNLWKSYAGIYKDPSNSNADEIFTVSLRDGVLYAALGDREVPCKVIRDGCFMSDHGLIEFRDTSRDDVKILVWGNATPFYSLDKNKYFADGIEKYLGRQFIADQPSCS